MSTFIEVQELNRRQSPDGERDIGRRVVNTDQIVSMSAPREGVVRLILNNIGIIFVRGTMAKIAEFKAVPEVVADPAPVVKKAQMAPKSKAKAKGESKTLWR